MEDQLKDLLEELEHGIQTPKTHFRSPINQPNLISISSANALDTDSNDSFSTFTTNMPRPALDVETIQLVNANIPQCVQNIPNTACGFWYYRLSEYNGKVPSINNLHFVRLLPSYYKQEFVQDFALYGFNNSFNTYTDVATQLALACKNDLGYTNYIKQFIYASLFTSQFCPDDIELTYNTSINKFQMTGKYGFKTPAWKDWDGTIAYAIGDQVIAESTSETYSTSFICIQANTDREPRNNPTFWLQNNQPFVAVWDTEVAYGVGRYVSYQNVLYVSIVPNQAEPPPSIYWEVVNESEVVWNRYLITGYNDPNVKIAQSNFYTSYDEYTLFERGVKVQHEGLFYEAKKQVLGIAPPSLPNWELVSSKIISLTGNGTVIVVKCDNSDGTINIGDVVFISGTTNDIFNSIGDVISAIIEYEVVSVSPTEIELDSTLVGSSVEGIISLTEPLRSGLYDFSYRFDMNYNETFLPVGIPPQPYNPTPRRLLNSILGFTWNGQFSSSTLAKISATTKNSIPSISTALYNRLRPVPFYIVVPIALSSVLGDIPAVSTQTFTAEGYCNLVYSSVINIYASIVYGSSLDTQRNTNLLASGTMDCGNLGVSFFNPIVNNPLEVSGSDIYAISFEIRDECNEPYTLTNNAITTFVLKIAYKK